MKRKHTTALLYIVVIVSFLGFWVENIWLSIYLGFMDNRNMRLPALLGYGLGVVAIIAMFGTPQQPRFFKLPINLSSPFLRTAVFYLFACLSVMIGEIALGTLVEKICGVIWWEYTSLPLNITKYTCVPTTLAFGALITFFMGHLFPPVYRFFCRNQSNVLTVAAWVLLAILVVDWFFSILQMYQTGDFVNVWRINFA